jgi:thiamine kinase-like enzyme
VDLSAEIPRLLDVATVGSAKLPVDIAWLADHVLEALAAIAAGGIDLVPAHGDGNATNVMLGPDGAVRLLDYDAAGSMDPFLDLGSYLVEAHEFDPGAREAFEVFWGRFDERLFNRARLYGVADDLRWGLIGAVLAARSRRVQLEFLKFADWRFLRCRLAVRDPRFEERVRRL